MEDIPNLEKDLDCSYQAEPMEGLFLEIVKGQLEKAEKYPNNYLWYSFWFVIRSRDRVVVGSACFKDIPNTEQENVSHIIAETDIDGLASQRILQRCGFVEKRREESIWWRL